MLPTKCERSTGLFRTPGTTPSLAYCQKDQLEGQPAGIGHRHGARQPVYCRHQPRQTGFGATAILGPRLC